MRNKSNSILIIGNYTLFVEGIKSLLESQNKFKTIHTSNNAKDGLMAFKNNTPMLTLVHENLNDIYTPNLIQEILLLDSSAKILVLSTKITEFSTTAIVQAGAVGILSCRNSKDIFIKGIDTIIEGNSYYCSIASHYLAMGIRNNKNGIEKSLDSLSNREKELFFSFLRGKTNSEIADFYHISKKTISSHKSRIYSKLRIKNQFELFMIGLKLGFYDQSENDSKTPGKSGWAEKNSQFIS